MSGTRGIINEGYPGHYADMQRLADQAAGAADEVWGGIAGPAGVYAEQSDGTIGALTDRSIIPLAREDGTAGNSFLDQLLVVPRVSVNGKLTVHPAIYQVAHEYLVDTGDPYAVTPALVAKQNTLLHTGLVPANSTGSTIIYLLYATVARSVTVTGSRPKRTSTGITTQPLDLATDPTVTITLLAGTPGGAAPTLPGDTPGSAYNFALAQISIANGYTEGNAITTTQITQVWVRGGVHPERMRPIVGGDAVITPALISSRIGPPLRAYCPVVHSANPQTKALLSTSQYDMRQRVIRVRGIRPKLDTTYKAPEKVTVGGYDTTHAGSFDSGLVFTGTDGAVGTPCYSVDLTGAANGGGVGGGGNDLRIQIYADTTTGGLVIKFTGNSWGAADAWWIEVEFSGSLKQLRNA